VDFDGDGRVDLAIQDHGGEPILPRNTTANPGHRIRIRLRQDGGNTRALGALVTVRAGDLMQRAQVGVDGTDLSQRPADRSALRTRRFRCRRRGRYPLARQVRGPSPGHRGRPSDRVPAHHICQSQNRGHRSEVALRTLSRRLPKNPSLYRSQISDARQKPVDDHLDEYIQLIQSGDATAKHISTTRTRIKTALDGNGRSGFLTSNRISCPRGLPLRDETVCRRRPVTTT
jgi:hypothetical protein